VSDGTIEVWDGDDPGKWPKTLGRHLEDVPTSLTKGVLPVRLRVDRLEDLSCVLVMRVLRCGVRGKIEIREEGGDKPLSARCAREGDVERKGRLKPRKEDDAWRIFEVRRDRAKGVEEALNTVSHVIKIFKLTYRYFMNSIQRDIIIFDEVIAI